MISEELIEQCQAGDMKSQKTLYELLSPGMFRVCYRYVKNQFDAEDVLVQGFVKVFKNLPRFESRGPGSLVAWIKRIMVNESLMLLRKKHDFKRQDLSTVSVACDSICALDTLAAEDIYNVVKGLPTGYRTVFNLYVIEGYSHKEIGIKLNISDSTSKSQLSKAKAMLRRILVSKETVRN